MLNLGIKEVTKENKGKYLNQIANLEIKVLKDMESKGEIGQLFITGKEDIEEYIDSIDNTVVVAVDKDDKVNAATYITQNQLPYTYNDITKYFKYGKEYNKYIKDSYNSDKEYKMDMLKTYEIKMKAYKYAKNRILEEYPEYSDITQFLQAELNDKNNKFHEKSILREKINKYMSEYIEREYPKEMKLYEKFYWITASDIGEEFDKKIDPKEHEKILKNGRLKIYNKPDFDITKYYGANTKNTVEIDTYITEPDNRQVGLARIIVFEGIKKHINKHFENRENNEIFLCSTLHKNNLSSKYVSEFFGLTDNLFVNRRNGRDREVHIFRLERKEAKQYIEDIENKLVVLYGYNPKNKKISIENQIEILKEQLQYERNEVNRLKIVTHKRKKRFKSKKNYLKNKQTKVDILKNRIKELRSRKNELEEKGNER